MNILYRFAFHIGNVPSKVSSVWHHSTKDLFSPCLIKLSRIAFHIKRCRIVAFAACFFALLSGCASGPDWRPLAQFSDEAGIALTAAHKAHAESIERDTRARWHDCTSRPAGEVVECRRRAIDLAFDAYRPQGQALDKAIFTQRMLAATIETALLCKASVQPGDCEKVAFEQALKLYPEVRAFLIGLKKEREQKK